MSTYKFKKNDEVLVVSGKDKGKKGKIAKVIRKSDMVIIPSLNISKRHVKKRDEKNPGGIIDFPKPLSMGKIALICAKCGKQTRAGFIIKNGKKVRICRKCQAAI